MTTRVAFVTGASRGLGEAFAAALAAAGWDVVAVARHASAASRPRVRTLIADLADVAGATATVGAAMHDAARAGPARALLINNAATAGPVGRLGALDALELRAALDVNLVAPVALANAFCATMADVADCRVINVSSGLAARAMSGEGLYSIAKCAMEMLTRTLAADHPRTGFAAVTYRPGIIDTGMQAFLRAQSPGLLPDVEVFREFHASGALVEASRVARLAIAALVDADVRSGETYDYRTLAASTDASAAGDSTKRSAPANSSRDP